MCLSYTTLEVSVITFSVKSAKVHVQKWSNKHTALKLDISPEFKLYYVHRYELLSTS